MFRLAESRLEREVMKFEEALQYMEGRLRFGWKLGNDRVERICEQLGNPQWTYPVIHIAGTKGKGSTTALCASILRSAGYKVGSYFSPYVYDVRERVQIDGQYIPREAFGQMIAELRPYVDAFDDSELGPVTEFELKTLLAFLWFAHEKVDIAVIEVGLGGRLDATNIVRPIVTAITNIGLDHTQILGDTPALIAAEKAGILKQGIPAFTASANREALQVIERIAGERSVPLAYVRKGNADTPTKDPKEVYWQIAPKESPPLAPVNIATEQQVYSRVQVSLTGEYQRENAALAVALAEKSIERMGGTLSSKAVSQGLAQIRLPGRFEVLALPNNITVVLDGAHNGMAAEALAGALEAFPARRTLLVMGMLTGHEPEGVLQALCPRATRLYTCAPQWKRAFHVAELTSKAKTFMRDVTSHESVPLAVQSALRDAKTGDLILITGSFYTVGEASPHNITSWYDSL